MYRWVPIWIRSKPTSVPICLVSVTMSFRLRQMSVPTFYISDPMSVGFVPTSDPMYHMSVPMSVEQIQMSVPTWRHGLDSPGRMPHVDRCRLPTWPTHALCRYRHRYIADRHRYRHGGGLDHPGRMHQVDRWRMHLPVGADMVTGFASTGGVY